MAFPGETGFILGLDLGTQSLGWCLLEAGWDSQAERWVPHRIEGMGSRIFDPGVEGDISRGRDESRGAKRRMVRGQRRNTERRAGRMHALFLALLKFGLLPRPELPSGPLPLRIHSVFDAFDRHLVESGRLPGHAMPYALRAQALERQLSLYEIGRAIYHLAQRRGFKSNRKAEGGKDEDTGKVKGGIKTLREDMQVTGSPTLGSHFARMNSEDHSQSPNRIRQRHKGRDMVEAEFEAIWNAQAHFYPSVLTQNLRQQIHDLVFFQRPLKSAAHLIGFCTLEQGHFKEIRIEKPDGEVRAFKVWKAPRRAPMADLASQRFRILQKVNDLRFLRKNGVDEPLTAEQRDWLLEQLELGDVELKWNRMPEAWGLKRGDALNFKELIGNRTRAKIDKAIPGLFGRLPMGEQEKLVRLLRAEEDPRKLTSELEHRFALSTNEARLLSDVKLENKYLSLSHKAIQRLLPQMEKGFSYSEVVKEVYGDKPEPKPADLLPRVLEALPTLRNPMVARTLTELRKVVNAIIRRYGKPAVIRIELARDLKKSREIRKEIAERQGKRQKQRDRAKEAIIREAGRANPSGRDIERYLLWEECHQVCPYTGRAIGLTELFSDQSGIDIEHIIPFSRSLDDSFANKTLCWADHNRNVKKNMMPTEAYREDVIEEILARVQGWPDGPMKSEKLRRFRQTEVDSDFSSTQLNDTAMASRLAGGYLSCLYGGRWDADKRLRIQCSKGQVSAILRGLWGLNPLLGGGEKNRGDHRHHAIDAMVVALSDPATLKSLSIASAQRAEGQRTRFAPIPQPWNGFVDDARRAVEGITISRRIARKLNGQMHKETIYGLNAEGVAHQRVEVVGLSAKDVPKIIDSEVRRRVQFRLEELGQTDPKKAFKDPSDHPFLLARDGRRIPIHKVRIGVTAKLMDLGEGHRIRRVESAGNHHLAITQGFDEKGRMVWTGRMVTIREAMCRHAKGQAVIQREAGFVMSLRSGDTVSWERGGVQCFGLVRTVADGDPVRIGLVSHTDARKKEDQIDDRAFFLISMKQAREMNLTKIDIDPLGVVRAARD